MRTLLFALPLSIVLSACLDSATPGKQQAPKQTKRRSKPIKIDETPLPPPKIAPLDDDSKVPVLRTQVKPTPEPDKTETPFGISAKDQSAFAEMSEKVLEDKQEQNRADAPPIKRLDNGRLQIGRIIVDQKAKTLNIPSQINMSEGLLEYYAVGPQGKLHESVLVLFAPSSHIHLSLILLGAEPSYPEGTRLELTIEWMGRRDGEKQTVQAHEWLLNRKTKKPPEKLTWLFRGSRFFMGTYSGDQSQSTIGLIQDPDAVIDILEPAGVPYRGDTLGFAANKEKMPPVGTRTTLRVKVLHTPIPMFPKPKDQPPPK